MKLTKKLIALVLSLVFVISNFSSAVFANGISFENSMSTDSRFANDINKVYLIFTAPTGANEIEGIQFSVDFPEGYSVDSYEFGLSNSEWDIYNNFETNGRILFMSKGDAALSADSKTNLVIFTVSKSQGSLCSNNIKVTIEDISYGSGNASGGYASKELAFYIHNDDTLKNYLEPTCIKGYSGDIHCSDCDTLMRKGEDLAPAYDHNFVYNKKDDNNHWTECICGEKNGLAQHTLTISNNGETHNSSCDCGYETDEVAHTFVGADCKQDGTCVCGATGGKTEHSVNIPCSDETHHWKECVCGEKEGYAHHDFVGASCVKDGICECGKKGGKKEHIYNVNGNNTKCHWKQCACGFIDALTIRPHAEAYVVVDKTAYLFEDGAKSFYCSECDGFIKTETIARIQTWSLSTTKYTYNGKVKKPAVSIYDANGKKLVENVDYTLERPESKKVGDYTVEVTLKGDYAGGLGLSYTINPAKTSIKSLTAGSKKFTVKWSKKTSYSDGYEIQYSTSSKFTEKYTKTKKITKDTTTSYTIKKLTAKKKYYVRIRCYYKASNGETFYSDWCSKKSVTTKK